MCTAVTCHITPSTPIVPSHKWSRAIQFGRQCLHWLRVGKLKCTVLLLWILPEWKPEGEGSSLWAYWSGKWGPALLCANNHRVLVCAHSASPLPSICDERLDWVFSVLCDCPHTCWQDTKADFYVGDKTTWTVFSGSAAVSGVAGEAVRHCHLLGVVLLWVTAVGTVENCVGGCASGSLYEEKKLHLSHGGNLQFFFFFIRISFIGQNYTY